MSADQPDHQTSSAGIQRLRRALASDDGHMTHAEALAQLPAYCEAERLGLPVAQHYPDLTAHLDVCPSCAQEYVALQEALSWQDENPLPLAAPTPQPDLWFLQPRANRLRQIVTTMTQALVNTLLPPAQRRRLKYQLDPFFDRVAELGGQFRLAPVLAAQPLDRHVSGGGSAWPHGACDGLGRSAAGTNDVNLDSPGSWPGCPDCWTGPKPGSRFRRTLHGPGAPRCPFTGPFRAGRRRRSLTDISL